MVDFFFRFWLYREVMKLSPHKLCGNSGEDTRKLNEYLL